MAEDGRVSFPRLPLCPWRVRVSVTALCEFTVCANGVCPPFALFSDDLTLNTDPLLEAQGRYKAAVEHAFAACAPAPGSTAGVTPSRLAVTSVTTKLTKYYTPLYALHCGGQPQHHQYVFINPNSVCVQGISAQHAIAQQSSPVVEVVFPPALASLEVRCAVEGDCAFVPTRFIIVIWAVAAVFWQAQSDAQVWRRAGHGAVGKRRNSHDIQVRVWGHPLELPACVDKPHLGSCC